MASASINMQDLESPTETSTEADFRAGVFEKSKYVITRIARFVNTLRNLDSQLEALKGFLSARTAPTTIASFVLLQPDSEAAFIQKRLAQLHTMTAELVTTMSKDTQALQEWVLKRNVAATSSSLTGEGPGHEVMEEPTRHMKFLLEKTGVVEDSLASYLKLVKETEKNLEWNMGDQQGTLVVVRAETSALGEQEDNKWLPHPAVSHMQLRISELQERSSAIACELNNHTQILLVVLVEEATHAVLRCPLNEHSTMQFDPILLAKELKREFPELTRLKRSVAHAKEAIAQTQMKYLKQTMDAARWSKLPESTMELIFARLPLKAIFRLRCLNKHWKSFIFSPPFQQLFTDVPSRRPVSLFSDFFGSPVISITFDTCAHEWFNRHLHSPTSSSRTHVQPLVTAGGLLACKFSHTTVANVQQRIVVMNPTTNSQRLLPPCEFADVEPGLIKMEMNECTKHYTITLMYSSRTIAQHRHQARQQATTTPEIWLVQIYDSSTDHWSTVLDMNSCNIQGQIFKLVSNWNWSLLDKFTYFHRQTRLPIESLLGTNLEPEKTMLQFDSQGHAYAFCWSQGSEGIWECECPWLDWKKIVSIPDSASALNTWTSFWVWKDMFLIAWRAVTQDDKLLHVLMFDNRKQCWKEMDLLSSLLCNERFCWPFETRFDAIP